MDGSAEGQGLVLKNRLSESRSPYVRGHKDNPVAWQPWDADTLALAKKHNRLLFVSIGYAACHWCHVMEKESFMSPEIAELLNKNFISVKIDREERPDVDAIYMNYVQATTGSGGWPLNVFITPDLQPVFGGTYFPGPGSSVASDESVTFGDILDKLADVWKTQQDKVRESAKEVTQQLKEFAEEGIHGGTHELLDLDLLEEAYRTLSHAYDQDHGGLSAAPKFPTPVKLKFLLQLGQWPQPVKDIIGSGASLNATAMAFSTLRSMARGGIRDHVGGGFARYSVTEDWSLPHFEKMLYDQALLLDAYLDAFITTSDAEMLGAVYDIAKYLTTSSLARQGGGFYASEDADSAPSKSDREKREGAFYVWTRKELDTLLGTKQAELVSKFYNVRSDGNVPRERDPHDDFVNQNVLAIVSTPAQISKDLGIPETEVVNSLKEARDKMREHRLKERPKPDLDDKVITSWNGLAIAALARASSGIFMVDEEASKAWLASAEAAAEFIKTEIYDGKTGVLWRVWREGRGQIRGLADDYAAMISGCLELYAATFNTNWLKWADELMKIQLRDFWASDGGFYTAPSPTDGTNHGDLLLRLKSGMDAVQPSANSLSAMNLCRLASLLEDDNYETHAKKTVNAFEAEIEQWPASFPGMLSVVAWHGVTAKNVWLLGEGHGKPDKMELNNVLFRVRMSSVAYTMIKLSGKEGDKDDEYLKGRNSLLAQLKVDSDDFKVQVCEKGVCREATKLNDI